MHNTSTPSERARILEIGPFPPPGSGWATRIAFVKSALENLGHECVVLNLGPNRRVPGSDYECVRSGWEYVRKVIRYSRRGFLIHTHINGDSWKAFVLAGIAHLVGRLYGRRPVLTFHAGVDQHYFPRSNSSWATPILKRLFASSRTVICNSPEVKQLIEEYGVPVGKVVAIPAFSRQYLDVPVMQLESSMEEFLADKDPLILTYVENRPEYALPCLFDCLANLSKSHANLGIVIVGGDKDPQIGAMIGDAKIDSITKHAGSLQRHEFVNLLRRCTLYLRSARTEGVSASVREALWFGVPVVANRSIAHPASVVPYLWNDLAEMTAAVNRVLENPLEFRRRIVPPDVADTVATEVNVLLHQVAGKTADPDSADLEPPRFAYQAVSRQRDVAQINYERKRACFGRMGGSQ